MAHSSPDSQNDQREELRAGHEVLNYRIKRRIIRVISLRPPRAPLDLGRRRVVRELVADLSNRDKRLSISISLK